MESGNVLYALVEWLSGRGKIKQNVITIILIINRSEEIKKIVNRVFNELWNYIEYGHTEETTMCAEDQDTKVRFPQGEKELCKVIMKIFFWIEGLGEARKRNRQVRQEVEEPLEPYLRCIIGNMAILRMFGHRCEVTKYIKYADRMVRKKIDQKGGSNRNSTICDWVEYDSIGVGKILFKPEMEDLIENDVRKDGIFRGLMGGNKCKKENYLNGTENGRSGGEGPKGILKVIEDKGIEQLHDLVTNNRNTSDEEIEKILGGNGNMNKEQMQLKERVIRIKMQKRLRTDIPIRQPQQPQLQSATDGNNVTTGQYAYFSQMLVEWFKAKGESSPVDVSAIWKDLEEIFEGVMINVSQSPTVISKMCSGVAGKQDKGWNKEEKELCKDMVKILMYINGLQIGAYNSIKEIVSLPRHEHVDSYFRCLVGRAVLIKWLGGNCRRDEVMGTVLNAVKGWDGLRTLNKIYEKCEGLNFKNLEIGGKYLWPQIEEWAKGKKQNANRAYIKDGIKRLESRENEGKKCKDRGTKKSELADTAEDVKNLKELLGVSSKDELEQLAKNEDKWDKKDIEDTLKIIDVEMKKEDKDWEEGATQLANKNLEQLFKKNMQEKEKRQRENVASNARSDSSAGKDTPPLLPPPPQVENSAAGTVSGKSPKEISSSPSDDTETQTPIPAPAPVVTTTVENPKATTSPTATTCEEKLQQDHNNPSNNEYLTTLIKEWKDKNGPCGQGKIWDYIQKIFRNMVDTFPLEETPVKQICANPIDGNTEIFSDNQKTFCKLLLKIHLYMNGLTQWFGRRRGTDKWKTVDAYLTCVVGNVIIKELFDGHCWLEKFTKHVSEAGGGKLKTSGHKDNSNVCGDIDMEVTTIGSQLIGGTIRTWVQNERKEGRLARYENLMKDRVCTGQNGPGGALGRKEDENGEGGEKWFDTKNQSDLQEEIKKGGYVTKDVADEIVEGIDINKSDNEILEDLKEKIQEKIQQPPQLPEAGAANTQPERKGKSTQEDDWDSILPLDDDDSTLHTRSSNDEEEDLYRAARPTSGRAIIIDVTHNRGTFSAPIFSDPPAEINGNISSSTPSTGTVTQTPSGASSSDSGHSSSQGNLGANGGGGLGKGGAAALSSLHVPVFHRTDQPNLTSYFPLAPATIGITVMSYLLWKYFGMLRKTRKPYRRAAQVRGPTLQEQLLAHVDQTGPHAYTLLKERKPRSTPIKRRKKRGGRRRRAGHRDGVRRRMIIDIHLEVLDECQKGDLHSTKEDFLKTIVEEFMGCEFIKEENVPTEQLQCSDSCFMEERLF